MKEPVNQLRYAYEAALAAMDEDAQVAELKQFCVDMMDATQQSPAEEIYFALDVRLTTLERRKILSDEFQKAREMCLKSVQPGIEQDRVFEQLLELERLATT